MTKSLFLFSAGGHRRSPLTESAINPTKGGDHPRVSFRWPQVTAVHIPGNLQWPGVTTDKEILILKCFLNPKLVAGHRRSVPIKGATSRGGDLA